MLSEDRNNRLFDSWFWKNWEQEDPFSSESMTKIILWRTAGTAFMIADAYEADVYCIPK